MRETGRNGFQSYVKKKLKKLYPEALILKTDPNDIQGLPDLLILYNDKWASLEAKGDATKYTQPNQLYYVSIMNEMSFSSFIFPENETEVFDNLHAYFCNGIRGV